MLKLTVEMFTFHSHAMRKLEYPLAWFRKAAIPLATFQNHDSHLGLQLP